MNLFFIKGQLKGIVLLDRELWYSNSLKWLLKRFMLTVVMVVVGGEQSKLRHLLEVGISNASSTWGILSGLLWV